MIAHGTTESDAPRRGQPTEAAQRLEAWLSLPDKDRAELLNGRIVYKAMPTLSHGDTIGGIFGQLERLRGPRDGSRGGWWLSTDPDLFLAGQGMRPDVAGWRIERHQHPPQKINIGDKHLGVYVTPPDWVCEVLSPSTRARDEVDGDKGRAYYEAGVQHYWLVDVDEEQITVYQRGPAGFQTLDKAHYDAVKPLTPFEAVEFEVKRVFIMARATRDRP